MEIRLQEDYQLNHNSNSNKVKIIVLQFQIDQISECFRFCNACPGLTREVHSGRNHIVFIYLQMKKISLE